MKGGTDYDSFEGNLNNGGGCQPIPVAMIAVGKTGLRRHPGEGGVPAAVSMEGIPPRRGIFLL